MNNDQNGREPVDIVEGLLAFTSHRANCAIYQRSWAAGEPECSCGMDDTRSKARRWALELGTRSNPAPAQDTIAAAAFAEAVKIAENFISADERDERDNARNATARLIASAVSSRAALHASAAALSGPEALAQVDAALAAGIAVLRGQGTGLYSEAEAAIELLIAALTVYATDGPALIEHIADVAEAVGAQAGVSGIETAGAILSYLAAHPDKLERFLADGFVDLVDDPRDFHLQGRLTWMGGDGKLWSPEAARAAMQAKQERDNG